MDSPNADAAVLDRAGLQALIDALAASGHEVVGPRVRDGAIVHERIDGVADLPEGWGDAQEAGSYRLRRRGDAALFGYAVGPQSWKPLLHPPRETLLTVRRTAAGLVFEPTPSDPPRRAFLGVRACELRAMQIQDRVFGFTPDLDPGYQGRRRAAFTVAVDCGAPAATCFCASAGGGPRVGDGHDLALTELPGDAGFVVRPGSPAGAALLAGLPARPATPADLAAAREVTDAALHQLRRALPGPGLKDALQSRPGHPRWDDVGERCLSCGNCTMVCPTCFCTTVEDSGDLAGEQASRTRVWDSCFTLGFTEVHGAGSVRHGVAARYRQWLTHKLAHWVDQFGSSGCVGCGRCITWCPVGIDLTEEAAAIAGPEHG